jgi:hypothetical protein
LARGSLSLFEHSARSSAPRGRAAGRGSSRAIGLGIVGGLVLLITIGLKMYV